MEFNELIIGATCLVKWDKEKVKTRHKLLLQNKDGQIWLMKVTGKSSVAGEDYVYFRSRKCLDSSKEESTGHFWGCVKNCIVRRILDR